MRSGTDAETVMSAVTSTPSIRTSQVKVRLEHRRRRDGRVMDA